MVVCLRKNFIFSIEQKYRLLIYDFFSKILNIKHILINVDVNGKNM